MAISNVGTSGTPIYSPIQSENGTTKTNPTSETKDFSSTLEQALQSPTDKGGAGTQQGGDGGGVYEPLYTYNPAQVLYYELNKDGEGAIYQPINQSYSGEAQDYGKGVTS